MRHPVRHRAAQLSAIALSLALVSGCGQSDDAQAGPEPTESTSTTASATPSQSPTEQPQGAHGVTFTIENWSAHSKDPVVIAWKKTVEAFFGSVNAREPNAEFLRRTAKDQRRLWVGNINYARERDLVGAAELKGRVVRVTVKGAKATLVGCDLRETTNFRPRGEDYTGDQRGWFKMRNYFERKGDLWVMTDSAPAGRCKKGS